MKKNFKLQKKLKNMLSVNDVSNLVYLYKTIYVTNPVTTIEVTIVSQFEVC